ncbi:helix-turn-helix domain-containing protein [Kitasatospora sp. NPDC051170]|uniref:helix-turn-helix domain-containing protein n=1 Tax=Kitasatospora sp. NPDC051170 TaxID=3364056 RepID=UPI0037AF3AFD
MSEASERLAKALKEFREAEGISVRELAVRAEVSVATIRWYESGGGPTPGPYVARHFEAVLGWEPGSIPSKARESEEDEPAPE